MVISLFWPSVVNVFGYGTYVYTVVMSVFGGVKENQAEKENFILKYFSHNANIVVWSTLYSWATYKELLKSICFTELWNWSTNLHFSDGVIYGRL